MDHKHCQRLLTASAPPPIPSRARQHGAGREVRTRRGASHKAVLPTFTRRAGHFPRIRAISAGLDRLLMMNSVSLRGSHHDQRFANGAAELCVEQKVCLLPHASRHVMQTVGEC